VASSTIQAAMNSGLAMAPQTSRSLGVKNRSPIPFADAVIIEKGSKTDLFVSETQHADGEEQRCKAEQYTRLGQNGGQSLAAQDNV